MRKKRDEIGVLPGQVFLFVNLVICLSALLLFVYLPGCSLISPSTTTAQPLSPKAQALSYINLYLSQYADTEQMANMTNLTDVQKQVVRQKKALLIKLKPLVDLYGTMVETGQTPSVETQAAINQTINELVAAGGK